MATKYIANVRNRELSEVKLICSRCPWKGTADQALRIIKAPDGDYPYCPQCAGPCHEDKPEEAINAG